MLEIEPSVDERTQTPTLWKHRKKDGALVDVEVTSDAVLFEGRPARRVLANDVTRWKESEMALQQSEEQFRRIIEHSSYGKLLIDKRGEISLVNAEIEKRFGYTREELLGNGFEIL